MTRLALTPSQTVGPFLSLALRWADGPLVVPKRTPGAFWIRGRILDADRAVVTDALVETWQPDIDGVFCHAEDERYDGQTATPGFRGFGRSETVRGEFAIYTVRPGRRDGAPHLDVSVFARGLLDRLVTRIYLPDTGGTENTDGTDGNANDDDPVLNALDPARAATLVATVAKDGYRFDIRLRGDDETVFFAL